MLGHGIEINEQFERLWYPVIEMPAGVVLVIARLSVHHIKARPLRLEPAPKVAPQQFINVAGKDPFGAFFEHHLQDGIGRCAGRGSRVSLDQRFTQLRGQQAVELDRQIGVKCLDVLV